MISGLDEARIRAILLDVEGTTTPARFVYHVLFPYARQHVEKYFRSRQHHAEVIEDIHKLRAEHGSDVERGLDPPAWRKDSPAGELESVIAYADWLMGRDRKSTPLKSVQGQIWEAAYRSGELRGEVYPDVLPAFSRWQRQRRDICIYSSGSVLAQRLLFETVASGDLTPFISAYFDTAIGPKTDAASYGKIAAARALRLPEILFVSDTAAELDAAGNSGMQTMLCARQGGIRPDQPAHPVIESFDEVLP